MRLQLYMTKKLVINPQNLGWSLFFVIFWLAMGAYVFSSNIPSNLPSNIYQAYASAWFGIATLISMSSISTSLTFSLAYQTGAIPYLLRYSKMRAISYVSAVLASGLITGLAYGIVLLILTDIMYSSHFKVSLPPANIPLTIAFVLLSSLLYTAFSLFLQLIRVKYLGFAPATIQIVSFVPLLLGYLFGFSTLFLHLNKGIIYASPFSSAEFLLAKGYYGGVVYLSPLAELGEANSGEVFSVETGVISIIGWSILLLLISLVLFNKVYYRSIQEGRIV